MSKPKNDSPVHKPEIKIHSFSADTVLKSRKAPTPSLTPNWKVQNVRDNVRAAKPPDTRSGSKEKS